MGQLKPVSSPPCSKIQSADGHMEGRGHRGMDVVRKYKVYYIITIAILCLEASSVPGKYPPAASSRRRNDGAVQTLTLPSDLRPFDAVQTARFDL